MSVQVNDPHASVSVLLRTLKLSTMQRHSASVTEQASREGWSFTQYLKQLCELELIELWQPNTHAGASADAVAAATQTQLSAAEQEEDSMLLKLEGLAEREAGVRVLLWSSFAADERWQQITYCDL